MLLVLVWLKFEKFDFNNLSTDVFDILFLCLDFDLLWNKEPFTVLNALEYCDLFVFEKLEWTALEDLFLFENKENLGCLCVLNDCEEDDFGKFDKFIDFLNVALIWSEFPDFLDTIFYS